MKNRRNKSFMLAGVFAVVLAGLSSGSLGAKSAEVFAYELGCGSLNKQHAGEMNSIERALSQECASVEAAQAWEQSYNGLDAEGLMDGVVYE
ncbi:hypothetical protein [Neisseria montereyensis]|uniref:Secreted protein n=1 Tax=Neisseria montereyensis TaxID=2973938 RepID=A0ABT2FE27_9NEIS|nr:hypothetical protein [Neisseria montereyensis]MCS4534462.1 hypothetical protein [Neisseria montereyensis]